MRRLLECITIKYAASILPRIIEQEKEIGENNKTKKTLQLHSLTIFFSLEHTRQKIK